MAQKVVNSAIEFAYASEHAEIELKKELEKYFLYQNIVVIDERYESGAIIDKLISCTKCKFSVVRSLVEITDFETLDAIIVVNFYDIDKIKQACHKNNIPYIFILTKICDASVFKSHFYNQNAEASKCNFPLGIVFDMSQVGSAKVLTSQAIMEISSLSFEILQNKLENLFFGTTIDYEYLNSQQKIIQAFQILIEERNDDINGFLKRIIQLYLSYILVSAKSKFNVIDNLLFLYKKENQFGNIIEVKSALKSIVLSLEKNFLIFYTDKFSAPINYQIHQNKLDFYGYKPNFTAKPIINNKIDFILTDFRKKLLNYVNATINYEQTIKNILADIDIDNLYNVSIKLKNTQLTDYISLEPDIFCSQNFLTIMYQLGLLNFNF